MIKKLILALALVIPMVAISATLKAGSCRGISTSQGYKYVGLYCEDYQCTVVTQYIFDSWCPYQI